MLCHRKSDKMGEDTKISINLTIKKFLENKDHNEFEFPSSYTAKERAFIHSLARKVGLKSKSRGRGANRFLTIYKREGSTIVQKDASIKLQKVSRQAIFNLIKRFPLDNKERRDLLPPIERERSIDHDVNNCCRAMGRLNNSIPQVPSLKTNADVLNFRNSLTVVSKKKELLDMIENNSCVVIIGETGCGKTTQIPQFILEDYQQKKQPCRIICTQPRRLSAVSVAERVAFERDEKIGQTVGYQIRLESRVAPKTLLTYCTHGVLLRTLMGDDSALAMITHIVVDEIHERDRFCDFLLIALKDAVAKYRTLRVILMSATIDPSIFVDYFNKCPLVSIPGKSFNVDVFYLEDILKMTNYITIELSRQKDSLIADQKNSSISCNEEKLFLSSDKEHHLVTLKKEDEFKSHQIELDYWVIEEMDKLINKAWLSGKESEFIEILNLMHSENISINYQHSHTSVTLLMISAGRGSTKVVEKLLKYGANLNLRSCNNWTALDWAQNMNQTACIQLIEMHVKKCDSMLVKNDNLQSENFTFVDESQQLLEVYNQMYNSEVIDYDLILKLLLNIHLNTSTGSILIFLPGYDDIITMKEKIIAESKLLQASRYNLFILHSNMQTSDQKRVFKPTNQGSRKIILSTNIAETSITIEDVVYVIDSGKIKEKSFDAISGISTLRANWISQSCAEQRKGRAGRCQKGVCYRLYSSIQYNYMQLYQTPEILRLPLHELCLYSKQLTSTNTPIAEFLEKAIEPPSNIVTRNAVQFLKTIDALDPWEDVTELGCHLLDLPIEPRLGKMLLYAVVLKCLDPILTIACSLAYKDPFIIPISSSQKQAALSARKEFAASSYSDHMALLRAFQVWQNARANGWEKLFCEKHFVSAAVMEMIVGTRTQLLGQLRASGFVKARGPGDIRDLNSNSENWAVVKAALTAGMYPNLLRVDRQHSQLRSQKEVEVNFHPSSTLKDFSKTCNKIDAKLVSSLPCEWIIYEELSRSGRLCHAKTVTLVNSITVALFCGPTRLPMDVIQEAESIPESESDSEADESNEGTTILKLDDWIAFKLDSSTAQLILHLRQKWNALFLRRMKNPNKVMTQHDEQVIKTLTTVITNEEQALGLQQPLGIGQRPRPLLVDYYPATNKRLED
uniref:RNA helicase n=1 Tax=Trichogramma kaykai TaxID=54128 RepID=A0ABD2WY70_9HYME